MDEDSALISRCLFQTTALESAIFFKRRGDHCTGSGTHFLTIDVTDDRAGQLWKFLHRAD